MKDDELQIIPVRDDDVLYDALTEYWRVQMMKDICEMFAIPPVVFGRKHEATDDGRWIDRSEIETKNKV